MPADFFLRLERIWNNPNDQNYTVKQKNWTDNYCICAAVIPNQLGNLLYEIKEFSYFYPIYVKLFVAISCEGKSRDNIILRYYKKIH